ncbi:MAG: glycosyltransferase family 9 protein [Prosthecobacter sp.]
MGPQRMTLVIFKVNQLGDNVVFLPVVQALVAAHPDWRIVLLTSPAAARLYEVCCPKVELQVFETPKFNGAWRQPWRLMQMVTQLRGVKPDACLLGDDQGNVAHLLARLSGAKLLVGPKTPHVRLNFLIPHRVGVNENMSVASHNWITAKMHFGLQEEMSMPDLSAFGSDESRAVVIHAGASREYQRWPMKSFIELANRLAETEVVRWIDQGGETGLSDVVQRVKTNSLDDLVRMIAGARLFLGNNSGPMHIAAACGTSGVILIGPSSPRWDPVWHQERFDLLREPRLTCQPCDSATKPANRCHNAEMPMACMLRWSVGEVLARIRTRLN